MFGNVFFRDYEYKMVTHARVFSLVFKKQKISKEIGLYLVASLLFLNKIFSYNNMASFNKIKNLDIRLPCINYQISFDFMEQYVRELEAERVRELEAYLIASGLNNYQLTDNEREILTVGGGKHKFKAFKIGDLFDIKKGVRLTKRNMLKGRVPFIGSSALNNGCTAYISNKEHLHSKNVITVCYNGSVGESFYQENEFWASDDVNVLYPKFTLDNNNAMFFITVIKKLKSKYGYSRKWTVVLMKEDKINLPVISDSLDLEYISNFICSIKKLVIKGVVEWKDYEIEAYKFVVNK